MGLFWKRKSGDQFVSLRLNEPLEPTPARSEATTPDESRVPEPTPGRVEPITETASPTASPRAPVLDAVPTGAGPTPIPVETRVAKPAPEKAAPSRCFS